MSNVTLMGTVTGNRVLDILHQAKVSTGAVVEALESLHSAARLMASPGFGNGSVPPEQAKERAAEAVHDAAAILERLGDQASDLRIEVVRVDAEREKRRLLAHESGHALGCFLLGAHIEIVSIHPDDLPPEHEGITLATGKLDFLLRWQHPAPEDIRVALEDYTRAALVAVLLGEHAESVLIPHVFPTTFGFDLAVAARLAANFAPPGPGSEQRWLDVAHHRAQDVARFAKRPLRALVRALGDEQRLTGDQVAEVITARTKPALLDQIRTLMRAAS